MSNINKQALREELLNTAIGSKDHLRKLALALLDELEAKDKLIDTLRQDKDKVIDISKARISKLLARVAELEAREELFLRAKALMHQSGGAPIENSLNPIDAWLYDAERAAVAGKGE